jgi:hypothetical protein
MRRRAFITLLGGAAAWPLAAQAPQAERVRCIGVLAYWAADDAEGRARLRAFMQGLQQLGWSYGRNLRIDTRWATHKDVSRHAAELVALARDVLLAATGAATVAPLLQATRSVPIVFASVIDSVGAGFIITVLEKDLEHIMHQTRNGRKRTATRSAGSTATPPCSRSASRSRSKIGRGRKPQWRATVPISS